MNKQQRITEYNTKNRGYYITNIKKMTSEQLASYKKWGVDSLYKLYDNPSNAKISSWQDILATYNPIQIIAVQGSHHSYSVILQASNNDYMHITKANNYLVEVAEG